MKFKIRSMRLGAAVSVVALGAGLLSGLGAVLAGPALAGGCPTGVTETLLFYGTNSPQPSDTLVAGHSYTVYYQDETAISAATLNGTSILAGAFPSTSGSFVPPTGTLTAFNAACGGNSKNLTSITFTAAAGPNKIQVQDGDNNKSVNLGDTDSWTWGGGGGPGSPSLTTTASTSTPSAGGTVTDTLVITGNGLDGDPSVGATVTAHVCGPVAAVAPCDPSTTSATDVNLTVTKQSSTATTATYTFSTTAGAQTTSDQFWNFGVSVHYTGGKYSDASDNTSAGDVPSPNNEWFKVVGSGNNNVCPSGTHGTPPNCVPDNPGGTTTTSGSSGGASNITVNRIGGSDRIDTADLVSQATYADGGAGAVVLARSDLFPDSLAGTPLAVLHQAPILLTPPPYLDPRTQAEIQRVLPAGGTVYLLGQTAALSTTVFNAVQALGYNVVRIGGIDRFATAADIGNSLGTVTRIFLADGANFPDALTAAAASGHGGTAIILTNGSVMPAVSAAFVAANPSAPMFDIGGPAAGAQPAGAVLLVGADRYETAVIVAQTFFSKPTGLGFATGVNFPDALTAGPYLVTLNWPMLLTDPLQLPASVSTYVSSVKPSLITATVFGGVAAVSDAVFQQIVTLLS